MPREHLDQHRAADEQYILLIHNIPPKARWQELKDIAKDYCGQRVCYADTIAPLHTMGHVKINGLRNALKVYDEFRHHGWYGRGPLQVSLRGPVQNGTLVHGDLLSRLSEVRPVASYISGQLMGSEHTGATLVANYQSTRAPRLDVRHDYRGSYHHQPQETGNTRTSQSRPSSGRASTGRHAKMSAGTRGSAKSPGVPQALQHYQHARLDDRTGKHSSSRRESLLSTHATPIPSGGHANPAACTGQDIQLSNIPSSISDKQLCELLNRFGEARLSRINGSSISARFRYHANATAAANKLNGSNCHGTQLVATIVTKGPASVADLSTTRDKRTDPTTSSQVRRGPLVVDGAKGTRPRYRDHRSAADSDTSDDESDESSTDSDGISGWSGSVDGGVHVR